MFLAIVGIRSREIRFFCYFAHNFCFFFQSREAALKKEVSSLKSELNKVKFIFFY